jgi:hypothetical protein
MEEIGKEGRALAKTPASQLQQKLESDFDIPRRIAEVIVSEAEACLQAQNEKLVSGQRWVLLANREAGHGQALSETAMKRVCWTLDDGADDATTLTGQGRVGLRRVRIQRLLDEAVEQGALATQEDLAKALAVDLRTIKRDCQALEAAKVWLPLRGNVRSIGRGQTHKAQIVGRWLAGETYDQLTRSTRHHVSSISRYVQTFVRVVALQQEGLSEQQIAHLTQCGVALVQEYLQLYQQYDTPQQRERLTEQLQRLQGKSQPSETQKKRLP